MNWQARDLYYSLSVALKIFSSVNCLPISFFHFSYDLFFLSIFFPFHCFSFITRWTATESQLMLEMTLLFSPQQCYILSSQGGEEGSTLLAQCLVQKVTQWCSFFPKEVVVARQEVHNVKGRAEKYLLEKSIEGHKWVIGSQNPLRDRQMTSGSGNPWTE